MSPANPLRVSRAAIIGCGLLGGSVALRLRQARLAGVIAGCAATPEEAAAAQALGILDEASPSIATAARDADLIVVATPVGAMPEALRAIALAAHPQALVTDTGSTKRGVVAAADAIFGPGGVSPRGPVFVGAHPMAGTEHRGAAHASAALLDGAPLLLTPGPETPVDSLERASDFWEALGLRVHVMTADDHDRAVALTSHLPRLLASLLVQVVEQRVGSRDRPFVVGPGFRGATRTAVSGGGIWRDILRENADAVREALSALGEAAGRADALLEAAEAGEGDALDAWLDTTAEGARLLTATSEVPRG